MDRETPLIITATPNICWLRPEVEYPRTPEEMAAEASRCREAGASILHMHADDWPGTIAAVRAATDLIVQCGMSSLADPRAHGGLRARRRHDLDHHEPPRRGVRRARRPRTASARGAAGVRRTHAVPERGSSTRSGTPARSGTSKWLIERGAIDPPYFTTHLLRLARRLLVAAHGRGVRLPSPPPPGGVRRDGEHHGSAPDGHRDGRDRRGRPRPRRHRGPAARARRSIGDDPRVGRRGRGGGSRAGAGRWPRRRRLAP